MMRLAFYAPMESPDHQFPSVDGKIARKLIKVLRLGGNIVSIASHFQSYNDTGQSDRLESIRIAGKCHANNIIEEIKNLSVNKAPEVWITYKISPKSPDWIGPLVASALNIPYIIIEALYSNKYRSSPWASNLNATAQAIAQADVIVSFTQQNIDSLISLKSGKSINFLLPPFLDFSIYETCIKNRIGTRQRLAEKYSLSLSKPWLVAISPMRPGHTLASYRILGRSLWLIDKPNFHLLTIGGGKALPLVKESLDPLGKDLVAWLGNQQEQNIPNLLSACDICVWPAYKETFSISLLECQAAGLPVIAGGFGAVPEIIQNGETGMVISPWNDIEFAEAIVKLSRDASSRKKMGLQAQRMIKEKYSLSTAEIILNQALSEAKKIYKL